MLRHPLLGPTRPARVSHRVRVAALLGRLLLAPDRTSPSRLPFSNLPGRCHSRRSVRARERACARMGKGGAAGAAAYLQHLGLVAQAAVVQHHLLAFRILWRRASGRRRRCSRWSGLLGLRSLGSGGRRGGGVHAAFGRVLRTIGRGGRWCARSVEEGWCSSRRGVPLPLLESMLARRRRRTCIWRMHAPAPVSLTRSFRPRGLAATSSSSFTSSPRGLLLFVDDIDTPAQTPQQTSSRVARFPITPPRSSASVKPFYPKVLSIDVSGS